MKEELLSVGIDLGTSTTQLVFSRLFIENMASAYAVPRMVITKKEIQYKSQIYFTPLIDLYTIDFEKVKKLVALEYQAAGIQKEEIDTGAVIITGETARKENAKEVVNALSGFAGDFVVATAGPDLESVISGKGAGLDEYSKEHRLTAVNIDIGGGTSNLAVFTRGETADTGCLDIGGRLIKVEKDSGKITYLAPKIFKIIQKEGFGLAEGEVLTKENISPLLKILVEALEQSVGLRQDCPYYDFLVTNHGLKSTQEISAVSFSGGVAEILYHPKEYREPFLFGDMGVWLAEAIRESRLFSQLTVVESAETIRATVVGAGSHTTEISGSTITYTKESFPMKNLPVVKLSSQEVRDGLSEALKRKLEWFFAQEGPERIAVALDGEVNPSFLRIQEYARELLEGLKEVLSAGYPAVVVLKEDMAKVLGQTMYRMAGAEKSIVCLDGIFLSQGDYIDIGRPAAAGSVLPVVVKTLVFQS